MGRADGQGDRAEFERLLRSYGTALLVTRGSDGHYHARPMAMQRHHVSGDELWFATPLNSQKVHDLEVDNLCCVSLSGGSHDASYVSMSGVGDVVRERDIIRRLWEPGWKAWFPQGADEPDLALIRFRPQHVEYVHPHSGKLQVLFTMVNNIISGTHSEPAPKKQLELH
jgi:general stress protein 26